MNGGCYFLFFAHNVDMEYLRKGSISFGLVYIAVMLHSAIKENDAKLKHQPIMGARNALYG